MESTLSDNVTLPENVTASIQVLFMNRDPEFFPEPDVFKPERFAGERSSEILNPYTYVPFSAGMIFTSSEEIVC